MAEGKKITMFDFNFDEEDEEDAASAGVVEPSQCDFLPASTSTSINTSPIIEPASLGCNRTVEFCAGRHDNRRKQYNWGDLWHDLDNEESGEFRNRGRSKLGREKTRQADKQAPPNKQCGHFTQDQYKDIGAFVPFHTPFEEQVITPGTQHEVSVSYVVSPENFYTQISSFRSKFIDMMQCIPKMYKGVKSYSGTVPVGASVLARSPSDRVLYRATVIKVQSLTKFIVQYVDFGEQELVDLCNIYQLHWRLMTLPKMAVHCTMIGVAPKEGDWKADITMYFNAPRYNCIFEDTDNGKYKVIMSCNLADMWLEKQLAISTEHQSPNTLKDVNWRRAFFGKEKEINIVDFDISDNSLNEVEESFGNQSADELIDVETVPGENVYQIETLDGQRININVDKTVSKQKPPEMEPELFNKILAQIDPEYLKNMIDSGSNEWFDFDESSVDETMDWAITNPVYKTNPLQAEANSFNNDVNADGCVVTNNITTPEKDISSEIFEISDDSNSSSGDQYKSSDKASESPKRQHTLKVGVAEVKTKPAVIYRLRNRKILETKAK